MNKKEIEQRKTKDKIEKALIFLLKKYNMEEITITQIIQEAGVARNSYYRNYSSKEEVLNSYMDRQMEIVSEKIGFYQSMDSLFVKENLIIFLTHYYENKDEQTILIKHNLQGKTQELTNRFTEEHLGDMKRNSPERYKLYFIAGAFNNLFFQWLKEGCKETPEEMADIFLHLMKNSTEQVFKE